MAEFVACAILNIADDHIDWHGNFDSYARSKLSLLDRSSCAILNAEDGEIVGRTSQWQGRKVFYSLDTPAPGEIGLVEDILVDRSFVIDPQEAAVFAELSEVKPTIPHNVSNTLAAAGLARCVGVSHEAIRAAIKEFRPGRHRIEVIYEADSISWIDDSKATNPHAASAALSSHLSNIWIAGGLAKGAKMDDLIARSSSKIKAAILIGADAEIIAKALVEFAPDAVIHRIKSATGAADLMDQVVSCALEIAAPGDTVLLAPACASMDQFSSYAQRGDLFVDSVRRLVGE